MNLLLSITTSLIQMYYSDLSSYKSFDNIKQAYISIESDTSKTINQLNIYIPSISPINPLKQTRISSEFGFRYHPIQHKNIFHQGIDIAAKYGTPVHSTAAGIVGKIEASEDGYGKQIIVTHEFGLQTQYAHLHTIMVQENQYIFKGEVIGFVGSTGSSTGSHLHYEVIKNNKKIDPFPFCSLYTFDKNHKDYYENENIDFIREIESQIDSVVYGKKNEPVQLPEAPVEKPKARRRTGSENLGTFN